MDNCTSLFQISGHQVKWCSTFSTVDLCASIHEFWIFAGRLRSEKSRDHHQSCCNPASIENTNLTMAILLLLVICSTIEAIEQLKVPYDFAANPSYKTYYKLRQNDKFLYKNPKVRSHINHSWNEAEKPHNELEYLWHTAAKQLYLQNWKFQKYYGVDGSSTFSINEEISPNGITHGGYGYLDSNGDLVYIEYEKDPSGSV